MRNSFAVRFRVKLLSLSLVFVASWMMGFSSWAFAADNIKFKGTLVQQACSVATADADISVDFESINDKDLYANTRTSSRPFSLKLSDCKLTVAKTVSVTFSGAPNTKITGALLIPGDKGIAVGLEDKNGAAIKVDDEKIYPLTAGSNVLDFKAYIIGEPDALQNKTIVLGDFSSIANFTLDYP
ncbi:hypothetical protein A9993_12230 [Rahnella victoriana]|uniref:fimbrial protein n=1 Tax=Rahnella victoriana TaxID=1510570 RepID=UPI000BB1DA2A|nr:fimbrial protein [Rahnella victoriana]PBI80449.1 hypothetical protein A9993_12230 [Rahnella victoriana]